MMTEERIIAYLLGAMAEEERERFEEDCFSREQWPEELSLVEDDLVDDYLRGGLGAEQRRLFVQNYLTTEARRARVAVAAALLRHAAEGPDASQEAAAVTPAVPAPAGWWRSLVGGRPWASAFAAVLAVAVAAAGVWWLARGGPQEEPAFVALALNVSNSDRAAGPVEGRVNIPPDARELRLTLTLPEGSAQASRYRAELSNEEGEAKPSKVVGHDARAVSVVAPAGQLPRGRYALKLFAAGPDGSERRVGGSYFFKVE
jgi:hypothetical protein